MNSLIYRVIGNHQLVIQFNYGPPHFIDQSSKNYDLVYKLLNEYNSQPERFGPISIHVSDEEMNEIVELLSIKKKIEIFLSDTNRLVLSDGLILFDGEPVHGVLVNRILSLLDQDNASAVPLVRFLHNLCLNPSFRVREQLYQFLDRGRNTITNDGHFLAYKRVRANYMDVHSGTFNNSIGQKPEVKRQNVDDDPNRTCSHGLHVCSYDYLSHFRGEKVMVCKVNPADVVAIPADYEHTKMRVCKYEVVSEIKNWVSEGDTLGQGLVEQDPWDERWESSDEQWESSDEYY